MNKIYAQIVILALIFFSVPEKTSAKVMLYPSGPLVDHPVLLPLEKRSSSIWRSKVGSWGENLVTEKLRFDGYQEIFEIKNRSNNGIDRIAIKRDLNGKIIDVKFVEVKTNRSPNLKLNSTKLNGNQMSRQWLAHNFLNMRKSGDPTLKKIAFEISRFRKETGIPIEKLGEVYHINTKNGTVTNFIADNLATKKTQSINKLLTSIKFNGKSIQTRNWASNNLLIAKQIRSENMSYWLGKTASQQSTQTILFNAGRTASGKQLVALRGAKNLLAKAWRSAGPIATAAGFALEAKDLLDTQSAYQFGAISARQRDIQFATTLGGMGGSIAGGATGAYVGSWLGTLFGPAAPITVPTAAIFGTIVGGTIGYFGGAHIAGDGVKIWYNSVDRSVMNKFEKDWINERTTNND
jgi:hypothetical protein